MSPPLGEEKFNLQHETLSKFQKINEVRLSIFGRSVGDTWFDGRLQFGHHKLLKVSDLQYLATRLQQDRMSKKLDNRYQYPQFLHIQTVDLMSFETGLRSN